MWPPFVYIGRGVGTGFELPSGGIVFLYNKRASPFEFTEKARRHQEQSTNSNKSPITKDVCEQFVGVSVLGRLSEHSYRMRQLLLWVVLPACSLLFMYPELLLLHTFLLFPTAHFFIIISLVSPLLQKSQLHFWFINQSIDRFHRHSHCPVGGGSDTEGGRRTEIVCCN